MNPYVIPLLLMLVGLVLGFVAGVRTGMVDRHKRIDYWRKKTEGYRWLAEYRNRKLDKAVELPAEPAEAAEPFVPTWNNVPARAALRVVRGDR